jgi:replicative superfamily II helicase
MAFLGLFVGIDRYQSPKIKWLSCAKRDAVALHSLFADTLGEGGIVLTDEDATRVAIESHFAQLAACHQDDVVVIAFSGHGTETHELVTFDADLNNLSSSCIPLDILTQWFSRIPARRLVCFLDCCFSGGMGAKVLHVESTPRDLSSTADILEQLSGNGRLIFTASTATEPAWENIKLGHGLLTYYLLEALQGAEQVRQSGKIAVYRLLEYVTQRVIDGATQLGKAQHPTLRGTIDGELTWPQFSPGTIYHAAFPERTHPPVTTDIQSLAAYGFPSPLLNAWASSIPSLNQLQIDAINSFNLLNSEHLVVSAPTSSGKTMVGELAALKGVLERKRALFLLPLKALVNDMHQQFRRTYGEFGVRTIRATGEIADDIPALMRGQYDVCLMTYEKFAALVLGSPHILDQVGIVVVDEVQMIADESRGTNLEFILTLLQMQRRQGIEPQLVLLSAVIGDTNGLERWLGARLLRRNERPVPLDEGILCADGGFRFIDPSGEEKTVASYIQRQYGKNSSQDWIIPLVQRLVGEGKQVIVFRETRGEARGCALYLARELGLPSAQDALNALPAGDPSQASEALRSALAGGVAFHISDLDRDERLVIEEQFRATNTTLRVIAATTTLAMGVNTPAEAVVIAGLEHPGPQPYTVAEYKNIVGRAGRLGFAERGTSYLLATTPQEEHSTWTHYVKGVPEDLHSRFLARDTDPRSLIVRVLVATQRSSGQGLSADDIVDFLESSFGAFEQKQIAQTWAWDRARLLDSLTNLEQHKLIERDQSETYRLTQLGRLAGEGGVEVESITRLVHALGSADPNSINDPTLVSATQLTVELDDVIFPINKKSTHKEPQTWVFELQNQNVAQAVLRGLQYSVNDQHQATLRAKKAVACLLWITDKPIVEIEHIMTQFGGRPDGAAGPIRSVMSRTCDLLPIVSRVVELLHPTLNLGERSTRLLARLEVGVPSTVADLAIHLGNRLTRGDYQNLLKAELASIKAIEASTDEAILASLGSERNTAEKITDIRRAVEAYRQQEQESSVAAPILPPYVE